MYSIFFFLSSSSFIALIALYFLLWSLNSLFFCSSSLTFRSISFLFCSSSLNFSSFSFDLNSLLNKIFSSSLLTSLSFSALIFSSFDFSSFSLFLISSSLDFNLSKSFFNWSSLTFNSFFSLIRLLFSSILRNFISWIFFCSWFFL